MCLILFAWKTQASRDLIIVSNRDEFFDRPTQAAHVWQKEGIVAGRDVQKGGTQLGVSRDGRRFAFVTNIRNTRQPTGGTDPISRGLLVTGFLQSGESAECFLKGINGAQYDGFNLVVGTADECWYLSNHQPRDERGASAKTKPPRRLQPGVYGLCNAQLDTPWRKLLRGKILLQNYSGADDATSNRGILLDGMTSRDTISDPLDLPDTGYDDDFEQALSSIFVAMDGYGTRSTTLVERYHNSDRFEMRYLERSFNEEGKIKDTVELTIP